MVSLVDGVLLAALVGTNACVLPLYLKLKRLDRAQAEYGRAVLDNTLSLVATLASTAEILAAWG